MLTAVTGINWGDEGKGRVIDLLAEPAMWWSDIRAEIMQAILTDQGKFVLNLHPSGILHPDHTGAFKTFFLCHNIHAMV